MPLVTVVRDDVFGKSESQTERVHLIVMYGRLQLDVLLFTV